MPVDAPECPKQMEYGPCGGVEFDGRCEVGAFRCVFLGDGIRTWTGIDRSPESRPAPSPPTQGAMAMTALLARRLGLVD